jgi:hypothetical protein
MPLLHNRFEVSSLSVVVLPMVLCLLASTWLVTAGTERGVPWQQRPLGVGAALSKRICMPNAFRVVALHQHLGCRAGYAGLSGTQPAGTWFKWLSALAVGLVCYDNSPPPGIMAAVRFVMYRSAQVVWTS